MARFTVRDSPPLAWPTITAPLTHHCNVPDPSADAVLDPGRGLTMIMSSGVSPDPASNRWLVVRLVCDRGETTEMPGKTRELTPPGGVYEVFWSNDAGCPRQLGWGTIFLISCAPAEDHSSHRTSSHVLLSTHSGAMQARKYFCVVLWRRIFYEPSQGGRSLAPARRVLGVFARPMQGRILFYDGKIAGPQGHAEC